MILKSSPADYASAYDQNNQFCFEGVDPATPTEILFYDGSGAIVGARRYASCGSIATSPNSFLRRMLNPHPYHLAGCNLFRVTDRDVVLSVGYNDGADRTSPIHFTASQGRIPNPTAWGGMEQWRTISAGERDEIVFKLPKGCRIDVECRFDGEEEGSVVCTQSIATNGIYLFVVDADEILALRPEAEVFEVVVEMSGSVIAQIHFEVARSLEGSVRLAWLNAEGFISYHTFRGVADERVVTHRSECETPLGTQTLGVESWRESTLRSGYLSAEGVERLAGIATSLRVWRIRGENAEPQALLSHTITTLGNGARQVELTIRPAQKGCV